MNAFKCTTKDDRQVCILNYPVPLGNTNIVPAEFHVGTKTVIVSMNAPDGTTDNPIPMARIECRRDTWGAPGPDEYSCLSLEYRTDGTIRGCDRPLVGHRSVNQKGDIVMQVQKDDNPFSFVIEQPE